MRRIIVTGQGTDVGKTIVSAILTTLLGADYWKPVECGPQQESDTYRIRTLIDPKKHQIYAPAYSLHASLSPHHAARLENKTIDLSCIILPETKRRLVIETAGGIFVPLTSQDLALDLFESWKGQWIIVSRHYVGSINHTLLTIKMLQQRRNPILGIIFNGVPNPDSEQAILTLSQLPFLGRLLPESSITSETIQTYAEQWKAVILKYIQT